MTFAVSATVAVLGVASIQQNRQAAKEQRKAQRAQAKIQDRQNRRDKLQQIRQQRIATAQIQAQTAGQGLAGSSSAQGAIAGVTTGTAQNLNFINQIGSLQEQQNRAMERANRFASNAAGLNTLANVTAQVGPELV